MTVIRVVSTFVGAALVLGAAVTLEERRRHLHAVREVPA
jgi:hypothetical protein